MACTARFQPVLSPHSHSRRSTFPVTSRHSVRFPSAGRSRPPLVVAQAKRGSPSLKDIEVASPSDLQFETPLRIVEYPDPTLRAKNKKIETFDDNLKNVQVSFHYSGTDGIGLSAPQVGINVRLMVFNPVGERGEGEEIVLVNPGVQRTSMKSVLFNEGCLSFPRMYADVQRPESVKIDAQDINGARFSINLSGLPARIFQHEYDHLEGVLFFDRMTDVVLDRIRPQLLALEKKYEDKTGLPSPERVEETRKKRNAPVGFGKSR